MPMKSERLLYCDHIDGHGEGLFRLACEHDLEGIVAKRKSKLLGSLLPRAHRRSKLGLSFWSRKNKYGVWSSPSKRMSTKKKNERSNPSQQKTWRAEPLNWRGLR